MNLMSTAFVILRVRLPVRISLQVHEKNLNLSNGEHLKCVYLIKTMLYNTNK